MKEKDMLYRRKLRASRREQDKCIDCGDNLDCHSKSRCYKCLLKHKERKIRSSNGGLNPNNLSENVQINNSKLGTKIIGDTKEI